MNYQGTKKLIFTAFPFGQAEATTSCKNVETLSRKKQPVLLQIAASHRSVR